MAEDQQKKSPASASAETPSTSTATQQQPPKAPAPSKGPTLSRRAFLIGAVGASVLLTAGSLAQSGNILGPLIPPSESTTVAASAAALESAYEKAVASPNPSTGIDVPSLYSSFFYFPYGVSVSPYYKNIVVRIPDSVQLTSQSYTPLAVSKSVLQQIDPSITQDGKFLAYNTTCVHLRCLVNPGYDSGSGEFRLQCPCHGSQYRMSDGVPVAGPAHDLGLNPLPQITIAVDSSGNITAINGLNGINGTPGVGRTS
jgi:Rieske Fe-S protein